MAECSNLEDLSAIEPERVEVLPCSLHGEGDISPITNGGLQLPVLHVEILQHNSSTLPSKSIVLLAHKALKGVTVLTEDLLLTDFEDTDVQKHIQSISISDVFHSYCEGKSIALEDAKLVYHTFHLNTDASDAEGLKTEDVSSAIHWMLPAADFHGLWDSLIYDTDIKMQLLNFVSTTLIFSDKKVNPNIISWNRVVLLHGPPGTGKTSLCKALAQKLSIRLSDRYHYGELIEINSHSLFSKWFSESGKLVMKMFQKIQEIIDDPETLVFVMIDEIESLAHARKAALGGVEPSDAIRVVNALLTQLDQIKRYPNVIILTTSNITEAIDIALVDRADIKHYIGLPSIAAIYQIYYSCIKELQRSNIICTRETIFPLRQLDVSHVYGSEILRHSLKLKEIAVQSVGLSGRALRKLPFLAYAFYIQTPYVTLDAFLEYLSKAVHRQFEEQENLKKDH